MKIGLKIGFIISSFLCLTNSLVGQEKVQFSFNQDTETYAGSFEWSFPEDPFQKENGTYVFDLKTAQDKNIVLKFNDLNWNLPTDLPDGVSLRFRHNLKVNETFDLESFDFFSYIFSENITGNWQITYQLISNNELLDSKSFSIPYKVIVKDDPPVPSTEEIPSTKPEEDEVPEEIVEVEEALKDSAVIDDTPPAVVEIPVKEEIIAIVPEDEDRWFEIVDSKRISNFSDFIKDYPNSEYVNNAKRKITVLENEQKAQDAKIEAAKRKRAIARKKAAKIKIKDIKKEGNQFSIITENTINPTIQLINGDSAGLQISAIIDRKNFSHEIIIELLDAEEIELVIIDSLKPKNPSVKVPPLDNLLKGTMHILNDSLLFTFTGGQPPYSLLIGNEFVYPTKINANSFIVKISQIRDSLNIAPDVYEVDLMDNSQYYYHRFPDKIKITPPSSSDSDLFKQYWPALLLGFALLLVGFAFVKNKNSAKRRAKYKKNIAEKAGRKEQEIGQPKASVQSDAKKVVKQTQTKRPSNERKVEVVNPPKEEVIKVDLAPEIKEEIKTDIDIESKAEVVKIDLAPEFKKEILAIDAKSDEVTPIVSNKAPIPSEQKPAKSNSGFKIKARKTNKNKEETQKKWEKIEIENKDIYYPVTMDRHWKDSQIESIHFAKESIFKLDSFLRNNNTSMLREEEDNIPEIGGMLLGTFRFNDSTQKYQVTVEKFVAIEAKFQNNYRLEFDSSSLAIDLVHIQDEFPELSLVGWFHTHPGHGLFLSKPDLKIQNGFFREKYQFAMEIDSITENLDTGFFTRKKNGQMNNKEDRKANSRWFAWTDIEKFTRHKG